MKQLGMERKGRKGSLIVVFHIAFPNNLSNDR